MIVIYFTYTSTSSEADGSRSSATLYLVLEVSLKLQKRMVGKSTEIKYNIFSSIMPLDVQLKDETGSEFKWQTTHRPFVQCKWYVKVTNTDKIGIKQDANRSWQSYYKYCGRSL
jgi:hypothetical protein